MNVLIESSLKSSKAKIKIQPGGKANLNWINLQNIDFENHGSADLGNINMQQSGYSNEKGGTTNVDGRLTTNSPIQNKGDFNIHKTGDVKIFLGKLRSNLFTYLKSPEFLIPTAITIFLFILSLYLTNK